MRLFDRWCSLHRVALASCLWGCKGCRAQNGLLLGRTSSALAVPAFRTQSDGRASHTSKFSPSRELAMFMLAQDPKYAARWSSRLLTSSSNDRSRLDMRDGSLEGTPIVSDRKDELAHENGHAVFVYGTLKRGFGNHHHLVSSTASVFVGTAETVAEFPLFVDFYRVPYLVDRPGDGYHIAGEVWLVDSRTLAALDELEGVTQGRYSRQLVDVKFDPDVSFDGKKNLCEDGFPMKCWLYTLPDGREGTNLGSRTLMNAYTAEVHDGFVAPANRDMSRRQDWGGFD